MVNINQDVMLTHHLKSIFEYIFQKVNYEYWLQKKIIKELNDSEY